MQSTCTGGKCHLTAETCVSNTGSHELDIIAVDKTLLLSINATCLVINLLFKVYFDVKS